MVFEFVYNNWEFFVFVLVLSLFLVWKKKNLTLSGSFPFLYMLMYKTKLGLDKMDRWSKNHSRTFLYLSYFSIFVGIVGTVLAFILMFWQLGFIVQHNLSQGGGLVLPIKTQSGMDGAVPIFYVPFWYWLVALFVLVVVHEFAHGVIAQRFKIKIKSSGFAFLGILFPIMPAAFVEPDEKQLAKKPKWQQIAVFGAGSSSNFIFGILFLLISVFLITPVVNNAYTIDELSFVSVMNESSLNSYNVSSGEILAYNNITDVNEIYFELQKLKPNETVSLTINSNDVVRSYNVTTFESSTIKGKGMIGISFAHINLVNKEGYEYLGKFPLYVDKLLYYLWLLNIGIGIMNLLPIWITDGGQITRTVLLKYFAKERAYKIYNFISFICLILIIFTVWPSLLMKIVGLF